MMIKVICKDNLTDMVDECQLESMITSGDIIAFRRAEGWIRIGRDAIRTGKYSYDGKQRRKTFSSTPGTTGKVQPNLKECRTKPIAFDNFVSSELSECLTINPRCEYTLRFDDEYFCMHAKHQSMQVKLLPTSDDEADGN